MASSLKPIFLRGEPVQVRMSSTGVAWLRAKVLLDLGGESVIVGRKTSRSVRRVPRESIRSEERESNPASKVDRDTPKKKSKMPATTSKLYTSDGPKGLCALQRQAKPPRRGEMLDGTWAVCGAWLTSRSAPKRAEPTCPDCLKRLLQQAQRIEASP